MEPTWWSVFWQFPVFRNPNDRFDDISRLKVKKHWKTYALRIFFLLRIEWRLWQLFYSTWRSNSRSPAPCEDGPLSFHWLHMFSNKTQGTFRRCNPLRFFQQKLKIEGLSCFYEIFLKLLLLHVTVKQRITSKKSFPSRGFPPWARITCSAAPYI